MILIFSAIPKKPPLFNIFYMKLQTFYRNDFPSHVLLSFPLNQNVIKLYLIKLIGVIFDSKYSMISHKKFLKSLVPLVSIIFKSIMLSILEQNSFLKLTANKNALHILDTIQNMGTRFSFGRFITSRHKTQRIVNVIYNQTSK